jgi:hypothetical protein
MKTRKYHCGSNGEGLIVVIILLAIIGGGAWWLFNHKKTLDAEARMWGRDAIKRLVVDHDANFLRDNLSPQARQQMPPSAQAYMIDTLTKAGVPTQPMNIEENISFESHFFEPHGTFMAHLFYPAQAATLQVAISHPVGKWQLDDFTFTPERAR